MAFLYRLLPPRASFAQNMNPAEAEVMERHVAYWQDLLNRDVALAFGPVLHPEDPWGLGLLTLEDEHAAQSIAKDDPAVQSGTCTYELLPMQLVRAGRARRLPVSDGGSPGAPSGVLLGAGGFDTNQPPRRPG